MTLLIIILLLAVAGFVAYSVNKKQEQKVEVKHYDETHDLAPEATPEPTIVEAIVAKEAAKKLAAKKPAAKQPQAKKTAKKVK